MLQPGGVGSHGTYGGPGGTTVAPVSLSALQHRRRVHSARQGRQIIRKGWLNLFSEKPKSLLAIMGSYA